MSRIIPGVEIKVIKEVVPRQLGATGILGIVGHTERDRNREPLVHVGSFQQFLEEFGPGSAESMPEVRQAFANGVHQVVVAGLGQYEGARATAGLSGKLFESTSSANGANEPLQIKSRANGEFGNNISVKVTTKHVEAFAPVVDIEVFFKRLDQAAETYRSLSTDASSDQFFVKVINQGSGLICFPKYMADTDPPLQGKYVPANSNTEATPFALTGGGEATVDNYRKALQRLESDSDIDMITVSQAFSNANAHHDATLVYSAVLSHCEKMNKIARNRIGFGQIPGHGSTKPDFNQTKKMASSLTSDHFVLLAPHGYLGAVIGLIGGLPYYESPTFKSLRGVAKLTFDFSDPDLEQLLKAGVVPVDRIPRKGIAVVRGIHTDVSTQISVSRIADRAVREVQNIAQDFIGLLNTQAQRLAIKQLIVAALTRMERENALVPKTDGSSPAFQVEVESNPSDFSQGIVRIGVAVRPVRAIDFIYATILVQA